MVRAGFLLTILSFGAAAMSAATFGTDNLGAAADGATDATAAIQDAIDAAATERGGIVHLPTGRYLVAGNLVVRPNVTLRGEYEGPGTNRGTILLAAAGKGSADGPPFIHLQGAGTLRNIAIEYPEQSADAEAPIPYPYAVKMDGYTRLEDVFLRNPYLGVDLDGAHASMIRNLWGEPLRVGIHADHIHDICRIENVHFWPYFTNQKTLRDWVQQNGVAFEFGRSDWQYCFNTFSFGYHTGYRFFRSEDVPGTVLKGGVTNGNFVGIGADRCIIGIDVEDCFRIGVSVTNGEFAPFGSGDARGVYLRDGNTGNLTLVNCNFWAVPNIIAEVRDGSLNLSACNVQEWAVTRKDQPAFVVSGGRLNVNGCTFNRGGLVARIEGETTRSVFTGNTAPEPLEVESAVGDRAAFGANSPPIEVRNAPDPLSP